MGRDDIDVKHLKVTGVRPDHGGDPAPLTYRDDVIVVINQAFGPTGASLMTREVKFDDYPAIMLRIRSDGRDECVYLSPIHGDARKIGLEGLEPGTKCELLCPVTGEPLDKVGRILEGGGEAEYCALYLTPKLERGSMVYVSDVWGHLHSRIVDDNELISYWVASRSEA